MTINTRLEFDGAGPNNARLQQVIDQISSEINSVLAAQGAIATPLTPIADLSFVTDDADGSLPNGTYYVVVTGLDGNGRETTKSNEVTFTISSGGIGDARMTATEIQGAISYRIYYGSSPGAEDHYVDFEVDLPSDGSTLSIFFYDISSAVAGSPPSVNSAQGLQQSLIGLFRNIPGVTQFTKTTADDGSPGFTGDFATIVPARYIDVGDTYSNPVAIGSGLTVNTGASIAAKSAVAVEESVLTVNGTGALPSQGAFTLRQYGIFAATVTAGTYSVQAQYVKLFPGAHVDLVYGRYFDTIDVGVGATITTAVANWTNNIGGTATNAYSFWSDEQGVFRIRSDNTFDSVYQAIPALYNPQFAKYTPGATNFERIILAQWTGNVAQITTEKGGSGTLRGMQLGASTSVPLGFYGKTPTACQVLATGAGHTVDDVITALQTLGLVKQS